MEIKVLTTIDEKIVKENNIVYYGDLDETKGLYMKTEDVIFVNLGASQFRMAFEIGIDNFINEFTKTMVHEIVHSEMNQPAPFTLEGAELVCRLMSEQEQSL